LEGHSIGASPTVVGTQSVSRTPTRQSTGVAIFPTIKTEEDLVEQLKLLAAGKRWVVRRVAVDGLTTEDLLIGLQWTTATGFVSLPMGFGPFVTMPATRALKLLPRSCVSLERCRSSALLS
jgi:hypothetical protein